MKKGSIPSFATIQQYAVNLLPLEPVVGVAPIFGTKDKQEFANRQVQDRNATAFEVWKTAPTLDFQPLQLGVGHARFSEVMEIYLDELLAV